MFFEVNKYTNEELKDFWHNFAKSTQHYTSIERWSELIPKEEDYSSYLALTFDNIIYEGGKLFNEENEKTTAPFIFTSISVCVAKKTIFDYCVENVIPFYEFETYYQSTRLRSVFERTEPFSDLGDEYKKVVEVLTEAFPQEEITLWDLFTIPENTDKLSNIFDTNNESFQFVDIFVNILVFDFVRNYFKLPNERRVFTPNSTYDPNEEYETKEEKCTYDDECYGNPECICDN